VHLKSPGVSQKRRKGKYFEKAFYKRQEREKGKEGLEEFKKAVRRGREVMRGNREMLQETWDNWGAWKIVVKGRG